MGATQFRNSGRGKSAQDVFTRLQDAAEREYGDDPYNGTISTVPGVRDLTDEWKKSKKDLDSFIEKKLDEGRKYDCFAICTHQPVTNSNKIKTQVEHIVTPGTKKWVLKYVVYDYYNDRQIGSYNTKGDAVKAARAHTEKTQYRTSVSMEKKLEKGSCEVAKITYKTSSEEKDGQWIFFGWAAE
jgi:hypothetical protein